MTENGQLTRGAFIIKTSYEIHILTNFLTYEYIQIVDQNNWAAVNFKDAANANNTSITVSWEEYVPMASI